MDGFTSFSFEALRFWRIIKLGILYSLLAKSSEPPFRRRLRHGEEKLLGISNSLLRTDFIILLLFYLEMVSHISQATFKITPDPPPFTSQVLGLPVCMTTPSLRVSCMPWEYSTS